MADFPECEHTAKVVRTEYTYRGRTFHVSKVNDCYYWGSGSESGSARFIAKAVAAAKRAVDASVEAQR